MREAIRPLLPADATDVVALEVQARDELTAYRGADVLLAERAAVADWAALAIGQGSAVWVATLDDAVVGYLHLTIEGTVATVQQVYVHPGARELGCGDGLLEAAMAHARERGCTALEAVALPGDRGTKNLYERAGVTARLLVMRRLLG